MINKFEAWLKTNRDSLSPNAIGVFEDSLLCYNNNIVRPAYLLAYQGMLLTIRDALLRGAVPDGYTDNQWRNLMSKIDIDKSAWDDEVYYIIKNEGRKSGDNIKVAPLCMPNHVRHQFEYWRQLRNTCAHYKSDPFIKAHVLSLYAFIEHWLLTISVTGGVQIMLDIIKAFYDPSQTSDREPIEPILNQIPVYVKGEEVYDFFIKSIKIVSSSPKRDYAKYLLIIIRNQDEKLRYLKDAAIKYVRDDIERELRLIDRHPDLVLEILKEDEIRKFWYEYAKTLNSGGLKAIVHLIKAQKIESEDYETLCNVLQSHYYEYGRYFPSVDNHVIDTFQYIGYFDVFFKKYMSKEYINSMDKIKDINYRTDFYISNLIYSRLDDEKVKRILDGLGKRTGNPFTLRKRFISEVYSKENYREEFNAIANKLQLIIPNDWQI